MRFGFADPPYVGQSRRLYRDHPDYAGEVDMAELVERLKRDFPDGWVLCLSASSLPEILPLCPHQMSSDMRVKQKDSVRVLAWIKPGGPPYPVSIQYGWEPVILYGGRPQKWGRTWDYLVAQPERYTFRKKPDGHVTGAKPRVFCEWVFRALGARRGDEMVDLFPGSGAVSRAWEAFCDRPELEVDQSFIQEQMTL